MLPLDFSPSETPRVQLEVTSPLARNKVGLLIVEGAMWRPLKWIFFAFCGIFSEQIKKGLLISAVKVVFKFLHIPFNEEDPLSKKWDEENEAETPPE